MKRTSLLFVAAIGTVVTLVAASAQAAWIIDKDFNGGAYNASAISGAYNNGASTGGEFLTTAVGGQDGWVRARGYTYGSGGVGDMKVYTNGPGNSGTMVHEYNNNLNAVKVAENFFYGDNSYRTFTSSDTIEYHMWVYTSNSTDSIAMGLTFENQTVAVTRGRLAVGGSGSAPGAHRLGFIAYDSGTWVQGDILNAQEWYEVVAVVNFSPIASNLSPTVTFKYRGFGANLPGILPEPDEGPAYTTDGNIVNMNLFAGTLPAVYRADAMGLMMGRAAYDDAVRRIGVWDPNLTNTEIPEPSSIALAGIGVVMLLVGLRRRRK